MAETTIKMNVGVKRKADEMEKVELVSELVEHGVQYIQNLFDSKQNKRVEQFIKELEKKKMAFYAEKPFGGNTERDNVEKVILTLFRDQDGKILKTGTNGSRGVYDWKQTTEMYTKVMNIHDFPVAVEILKQFQTFDERMDSLYFIYYRRGKVGEDRGDYINAHNDKKKQFEKDAPFVLHNYLEEGSRPRTFAILNDKGPVQEFPMKDNELIFVSAEANDAMKHALKEEKNGWSGLRVSIVGRCISDITSENKDKIIVRPAMKQDGKPDVRSITYLGVTPEAIQMPTIDIEVKRGKGPWVHGQVLIEKRENVCFIFKKSAELAKNGDVKGLETLFETEYGLKYASSKKGYKGVYKLFQARMFAAKGNGSGDELEAAFAYIESKGFHEEIAKKYKQNHDGYDNAFEKFKAIKRKWAFGV